MFGKTGKGGKKIYSTFWVQNPYFYIIKTR